MGNQRLVHKDEERNLVCFELCYQYRYGWIDPMSISYIHMMREQHGSTYFCINYPTRARSTLMARLNKAPESVHQDFLIDYLAADGSLSQWQLDIGSKRKILIEKEKTYKAMTMKAGFDKETRDLHGMSREWLALREDLVAFDAQLGFLRDAHNMLVDIKPKTTKWNVAGIHEACNPFDVLVSQAGICSRWTLVYRDRTDICIQMLFHLSNQRIATSSQQIAHQTQKDSASMITLAAVTMIFLPGTFISAILSTTMFDYGHDGVQVSQQWWILLITTFLLTGLVFGAWYRWQYVWVPGHVEARKVGDVEE
ncbi:hypothetical protein CC86DRAFT_350313 [Ophiobolus disseminans]|uniref:Cora-domain-containing protein n=1 Tax=Ophiobolus disseminans TaxID=1469910 RepID=A0A6A7A1R1_9PLEO|nr:hypothetical protein CC86DRAFT_350313 [Ophiobolus disseminans]